MSQNATVELRLQIGQSGLLQHRCGLCNYTGSDMYRCAGCKIVRYCCRLHEVTHWLEHKLDCGTIYAARTKLSQESAFVHTNAPHVTVTVNGLQAHVFVTTSELQQARFHLADSFRKVGTLDGIHKALQHFLAMVKEWPADYAFLKGIIPTMMLQLDSDQTAYDLIKRWAKEETRSTHYQILNQNVYENVIHLTKAHCCDMNLACADLLLKLKVLMDMRNIRIVRQIVPPNFAAEIVAEIELAVIRSPLSVQNLRLTGDAFHQRGIELNERVLQLGCCIHKSNGDFWRAILEPGQNLTESLGTVTAGSSKETSFMIQYHYAAWYQTEGVIQTMKRALAMNKDQDDMCAMWSNFKVALEF